MFFDKSWSDVSDKEIEVMAKRLKEEMGGQIFHTRVDFDKPTKWIEIDLDHPGAIKEWLTKRD